ncbi:hypothetical protein LTR36_007465 [Oleoguttula mirabilis]|uniref:Uncharacterized protein n=1 Tax=Oleoguttula mirabilis TaxID=1507867 RepID=A0AAV9JAE2_9PEZI|nr:hypothetical protein LTR36_007465 [Oleoguttula mirabilis]
MASTSPLVTPGRIVILIGNLLYSGGAFLADWNETHVKNPKWPPHARFHNGQTMSLGICLASASLYFAFQPVFSGSKLDARDSLFYSAAIGSFYCLAGISAIFYPGTDWKDPDISVGGEQKYLFSGIVAAMWVGYALEMARMRKSKAA